LSATPAANKLVAVRDSVRIVVAVAVGVEEEVVFHRLDDGDSVD